MLVSCLVQTQFLIFAQVCISHHGSNRWNLLTSVGSTGSHCCSTCALRGAPQCRHLCVWAVREQWARRPELGRGWGGFCWADWQDCGRGHQCLYINSNMSGDFRFFSVFFIHGYNFFLKKKRRSGVWMWQKPCFFFFRKQKNGPYVTDMVLCDKCKVP